MNLTDFLGFRDIADQQIILSHKVKTRRYKYAKDKEICRESEDLVPDLREEEGRV